MAKYVNIDVVKEAVRKAECDANWDECRFDAEFIENALDFILAADVAPVRHGQWIERQAPHAMGGVSAKCSACGKSVQYLGNPLNYCPNCGAKMKRRWTKKRRINNDYT